jgi:trans-2,3-dihydro-3-hydroxyanthranilate isomerase
VVPARDADAVARAGPDAGALSGLLDSSEATGLYLFAIVRDGEAKARMFAPDVAVMEDPATGSAAGPLGAYLAHHGVGGMPGRLLIRQGEEIGRPSELHVEIRPDGDTWGVWVEGGVVMVGRGVFEL